MLAVRLRRYLFQLELICIFDTDGIQNDSLVLQSLGIGLHVILGLAVSDHHSNLRDVLASPTSSCLNKVFVEHEVQGLSRVGAAPHVTQLPDILQDVLLGLKRAEQELVARSGAVLDQADANALRPDVKAVDQRVQKLTDLHEVFRADAPRPVDHEDDVGHGLLSAD